MMGAFGAPGWSLPADSLFFFPGIDSSMASVSASRELGRTLVRHRLVWLTPLDNGRVRLLDTSVTRQAGSPAIWSGETFLQLGWAQRTDSGWAASWRLWNRTDGLGAPDEALAENAWRQVALLRGALGDSSLSGAVSVGGLLERVDPGSASLGIRPNDLPRRDLAGAGVWAAEGSWSGLREAPSSVSGQWSDLLGASDLRLGRTLLKGSLLASLSGNGTDTLILEASHDSSRTRSNYLLADRADVTRSARASWTLPIARQKWMGSLGWGQSRFQDFANRNPDLTKDGIDWSVGVAGDFPMGFTHKQIFSRNDEDRNWQDRPTGDSLQDILRQDQNRRDGDKTGEFSLADSLSWNTDSWSGGGIDLGLFQSLRSIRHPLNDQPSAADRPDEDLSKRQFMIDLRWNRLSQKGKPFFTWTTLFQEDVYLRAVRSFGSWTRQENRLDLRLGLPELEWVHPEFEGTAREQRDAWQFQPDNRQGILEYGLVAGGSIGPGETPWISAHWIRRISKSGAVLGDAFAPDRLQDVWNPDCRLYWRWSDRLRLEPWASLYLERLQSWGPTGWTNDGRSQNLRLGSDLVGEESFGSLFLSVAHLWEDSKVDSWIGSLSARMSW